VKLIRRTGSGTVVLGDGPQPKPARGEVLIRVSAAGLTPAELGWYPTTHTRSGEARVDAVPGHEFSGVVAEAGDGVPSPAVGSEVFGMNDWYAGGAMAEYCTAPASAVVPKPGRLSHTEAASVPISALTAWQGLFDRGRLQPGERVLIQGGSGGVGTFAIQLARMHGAYVVTTASARNREFVASLGAQETIDYQNSRFEDRAKNMDLVFDTVGGDILNRSWEVLKQNGRMITIASAVEDSTDPRLNNAFFIVEPNQRQLAEIAALIDRGRLRTFVDTVVPLSQAPDAYAGRIPRQRRGKIVVDCANTNGETS